MPYHNLYSYLQRDLLLKTTAYPEDAFHTKPSFKDPVLPPLILKTSLKKGLPDKDSLVNAGFLLEVISGQKIIGCRSKKSSAHLKTRQGEILGWQTTLRGKKRDAFLSKWSNYVLPIEEDLNKVKNLSSFVELSQGGMTLPPNVVIHIGFATKDKELSNVLLSGFNIPFSELK